MIFYGETGTMVIGGGNGYTIYDLENKIIKEVKDSEIVDPRNLSSPADDLDGLHIQDIPFRNQLVGPDEYLP